ncbi:MAG: addiction module protein, partial [Salinimicrobium sediminis]|nr:addiction module protein [Salinimicrobium sediminis]
MASSDLRNRVKEYVDTADVRLLKMIEALAETYHNEAHEPSLSEEQYEILDCRREKHYSGHSKSFSWDEVRQ